MASCRKTRPSYPPDLCSAETLAHRLDCSKSTIVAYVRRGLLPHPLKIGELVRWRWADVEAHIQDIEAHGGPRADAKDPYLAGLNDGTPSESDN